jgi:hypothetical protein
MSAYTNEFEVTSLPKLDALGAVALGRELLVAARAHGPLPATIKRALERVSDAHAALVDATQAALPLADRGTSVTRDADQKLDAAWGAVHGMLTAWVAIPGEPTAEVTLAERLLRELFPDGLRFLTLPFKQQWAESDRRLRRLAELRLRGPAKRLGIEQAVVGVEVCHARYGEVLGITAVVPPPPEEGPRVGECLGVFLNAARAYVLKVAAHEEPDEPKTAATTDALLLPVMRWKDGARAKRRRSVDETSEAEGTSPATEPASDGADPMPAPAQ